MPKKWTKKEEIQFKEELYDLYVRKNYTINEISKIINLAPQTVFQRLKKLNIPIQKHLKSGYLNQRKDIVIPSRSKKVSEFLGIMLGDGQLTKYQVMVHLGNKEEDYVYYVVSLISDIFNITPKISKRKQGYNVIYFGSVEVIRWLREQGLVSNKVEKQVDVPDWIFQKDEFMKSFVRGFFDTDGSIYRLRFGNQISLTNRSLSLLKSLQRILKKLDYNPSKISVFKIYLTQRGDLLRFYNEIGSNHPKKLNRLKECVGTQVVNESRL